jgi:hypothetical protein
MQQRAPLRPDAPDLQAAAGRLAHLGFLLVSPFPPAGERGEPSELVVAIHRRPTLAHFDPELIRYWHTGADRRGHPEQLEMTSSLPLQGGYSWGKIEVVDRLGVENAFVTMGGHMLADRVADDDEVVAAIFRSEAPILRMGGHSQAADVVALEMAAFFGRMMVPIDFHPGAEEALAAADPMTRYAAFVAFERARYLGHLLLRQEHPRQAEVLWEESERLRITEAVAWARGRELLTCIGLAG